MTQFQGSIIETTIEPDNKGGFGTLPLPLIVLCGGFPRNFVSDLESAHLSGSAHFEGRETLGQNENKNNLPESGCTTYNS
jgi:hypothetical protein